MQLIDLEEAKNYKTNIKERLGIIKLVQQYEKEKRRKKERERTRELFQSISNKKT